MTKNKFKEMRTIEAALAGLTFKSAFEAAMAKTAARRAVEAFSMVNDAQRASWDANAAERYARHAAEGWAR